MYIIQSLVRGSKHDWIDFDTANDKDKAELRFSWIKAYYPDDTFQLVSEDETYVTPHCARVPMPDGLQKYIDDIAIKTLYANFHKSTNGIWSRAEVVDYGTFEPVFGTDDDSGALTTNANLHFVYSVANSDFITDLGS